MILHLDADSFFASCAQAMNPRYRGKPLVTGRERSIATSVSYEAKKLGITRGMPVWEIKRQHPEVIIVASDYQNYSLFSHKMFNIVRRFTPVVEEYSIDEEFADIGGMRRPLKMTYQEIGLTLQSVIKRELDITVSIGIASTKVLAKVASSWNKPSGLTIIAHGEIPVYLKQLPVQKVWGIGPNTASFLNKNGVETALQFIKKSESWVKRNLTKPHIEMWYELKGESVYPVEPAGKNEYKSISKTQTFYTPTNDRLFLLSQLSGNLEKACAKARRYGLAARKIVVFLKQHGFGGFYKKYVMDGQFNRPTNFPNEMMPLVRKMFAKLYRNDVQYRATGVIIAELQDYRSNQMGLFEESLEFDRLERLYNSVDKIQEKFGSGTVYLGTSLQSNRREMQSGSRRQFLTYSLLREGVAL